MLVSVFLWSCVRSARVTKISADRLSPNGKACRCLNLLAVLRSLHAPVGISAVHGTGTCGSPPGTAAAIPTSSCCLVLCATLCCSINAKASECVAATSGSKSIQDSMSLLPVI